MLSLSSASCSAAPALLGSPGEPPWGQREAEQWGAWTRPLCEVDALFIGQAAQDSEGGHICFFGGGGLHIIALCPGHCPRWPSVALNVLRGHNHEPGVDHHLRMKAKEE